MLEDDGKGWCWEDEGEGWCWEDEGEGGAGRMRERVVLGG